MIDKPQARSSSIHMLGESQVLSPYQRFAIRLIPLKIHGFLALPLGSSLALLHCLDLWIYLSLALLVLNVNLYFLINLKFMNFKHSLFYLMFIQLMHY